MSWLTLTEWALGSALMVLAVLAVRALLKNKISLRARYALWVILAVRLLVPVQLPFSLPVALPALDLPAPQTHQTPVGALPGTGDQTERTDVFVTAAPGGEVTYISPFAGNYAEAPGQVQAEAGSGPAFSQPVPLETALTALWALGAAAVLVAVAVSNLRFSRKLRRVCRPLEVEGCPLPVYVAAFLPSPCLAGLLWPAVYLTPEAAEDKTTLRHVLAHELTHYAHRDHLWGPVRCLCLALHWYNPLVWLAAGLSKRDGELACDEGAVERLGEAERIPYGKTLVGLVARRTAPADLLSCSTAMTGSKKSIRERVELLVKQPHTVKTALFAAVSVLALCLLCAFAGGEAAPAGIYGGYMGRLEQAQSIRIGESPISSFVFPEPISDPGLLAEARELLAQAAPLEDAEEIEDAWEHTRTVTLTDGAGLDSVYRLCTFESRCYLAESAENWDDPFVPFAVLPGETNIALIGVARRQADFAGGTTPAEEVPDMDELALRLVLQDPIYDGMDPEELLELLKPTVVLTRTDGDRTLLLVQFTGLAHVDGFDNLAAGVWDNAAGEFLPDLYYLRGDEAHYTAWTEWGELNLLCANTATFQGVETSCAPLWLRLSGGELERVTDFPESALEAGVELPSGEVFFGKTDYWLTHKILPEETGFTLYEAVEGEPTLDTVWAAMGYVLLTATVPGEENAAVSGAWGVEETFTPDPAEAGSWNADFRATVRGYGDGDAYSSVWGSTGALTSLSVSPDGLCFTGYGYFETAQPGVSWEQDPTFAALNDLALRGITEDVQGEVSRWLYVTKNGQRVPGTFWGHAMEGEANFNYDFDEPLDLRDGDRLEVRVGPITVSDGTQGLLPGVFPMDMEFASGAGGWSTDIVLQADGTFTGEYRDNDMGENTAYICSFHGKFGDIQKVSDASWSMTLEELVLDTGRPVGAEWREGGIRYVSSTPYGFDRWDEAAQDEITLEPGTKFMFYTPGATGHAPGTELYGMEEFWSWIPVGSRGAFFSGEAARLGCYGLCAVETERGFFTH